jgi:hypothetical protein
MFIRLAPPLIRPSATLPVRGEKGHQRSAVAAMSFRRRGTRDPESRGKCNVVLDSRLRGTFP